MIRTSNHLAIAGFALGCAGCGIGLLFDAKAMLALYLVVWFTFCSISFGAIAVLLTSYLVRGGWTGDLYPILARAVLALPAFALLFIPFILGMGHLYPWASDAILSGFKSAYLSPWLWTLRAVVYFLAMWAIGAWAVQAYGNQVAMRRVASIGLIAWPLIVSFAGIDWLESVEPDFHSSIYGLLAVAFALLSGFAFPTGLMLLMRQPHRMRNSAYSAVLFSILLLWAYFHAMQYIVIWTGNIPDEVGWYLVRMEGAWSVALAVLYIGQFVLPFFLLLSARVRRSRRYLLGLAALTAAMRLLEAVVLVVPPQQLGSLTPWLCLLPALLMIGCGFLISWKVVERMKMALHGAPAPA
jgi:hypothetical protein